MSDTPRTDKLVQIMEGGAEYAPLDKLLPHARQLERELNAAKAGAMPFVSGRDCARCGKPVYLPTNRHQKAPIVMGEKVWHGECAAEGYFYTVRC